MENNGLWLIIFLSIVMGLVLLLPFFSKKVERELEIFLFIMGILTVTISGLLSFSLLHEMIVEPIKITIAVLLAGIIFRSIRPRIKNWINKAVKKVGFAPLIFLIIFGLGLLSSIITAIIAALILVEIISIFKLDRNVEIRMVIITCFAIGLGAVLTPLGEPLATIASAKLKGAPYHAGFFFLANLLGVWVIPAVAGLSIFGALIIKPSSSQSSDSPEEDSPESYKTIVFRSVKVYIFVMALILLGTGFTPIVERYLIHIPVRFLYWINMVSAVLDNATLAAAEINPKMSQEAIKYVLIGLLTAGGILIPGNIPNIICAGKLSIKSKEWAKFGFPIGIILLIIYFLVLNLTS